MDAYVCLKYAGERIIMLLTRESGGKIRDLCRILHRRSP